MNISLRILKRKMTAEQEQKSWQTPHESYYHRTGRPKRQACVEIRLSKKQLRNTEAVVTTAAFVLHTEQLTVNSPH